MAEIKIYSTISCPCSSYAVGLEGGNIGCERDNFGVIESITPILISNHSINNKYPKKGDKWLCTNHNCKQGDFQWSTFHVVNVTNHVVEVASPSLNSKKSTLGCYIPPTKNLNDYLSNSDNLPTKPISTIGNMPLFEDEASASFYGNQLQTSSIRQSFLTVEEYNKDGLSGYLPVDKFEEEKLITNIIVNGVNLLDTISQDYVTLFKEEHNPSKMVFKSTGDLIRIKMNGINNPNFTVSLKDSSGCSVFKKKYKNVVCQGACNINGIIPSLPNGVVSEVYDLKISLAADAKFYNGKYAPTNGVINVKIRQYKNPSLRFNINNSTLSNCTTTTDYGVNRTISGVANSLSKTSFVFTTTLTSTTKNLYVKDPTPALVEMVTKNNIIKKTIVRENTTDTSKVTEIEVATKAFFDSDNEIIYQGDVKDLMFYKSSVSKTKTIRKSIDLDIHKEPCDDCDETNIFTNRFEIDDTRDVFEGMRVFGTGNDGKLVLTSLKSIDCSKSVTLEDFFTINKDTELTFDYDESGTINTVKRLSNGNQYIELSSESSLPHGSEITFESGVFTGFQGYTKHSVSGAYSIVLTTVINRIKYGQENVTFTLDLDKLVTYTPNNFDQYLTVGKNIATTINTTIYDSDYNASKKATVVSVAPKNGTFDGLTYTPHTNFTGKDKFTYTLTSANKAVPGGVSTSAEKTIFITVK